MKVKVAVVGVSGYAGLELLKLIARHPRMELVAAMDAVEVGEKPVSAIHPRLRGIYDLVTVPADEKHLASLQADTVFLCTPDRVSHELAPKLLALGMRVVDFSGAFRLKDPAAYPRWYGFQHGAPELLKEAVYGLPEWNGAAIGAARLLANPGCYPTSVILALRPLIQAGIVENGSDIICDSKSGATGAGRGVKAELMFSEVMGNFRAYNPVSHRHVPEMCQELGWGLEAFTFVPHLLPINRGILSTIYVRFRVPIDSGDLESQYRSSYSRHPLIRILGDSKLPELSAVSETNFCDIAWRLTRGGRCAIIFSAIDNLVKGASGQAVQNFNLMHGFDENTGL